LIEPFFQGVIFCATAAYTSLVYDEMLVWRVSAYMWIQ